MAPDDYFVNMEQINKVERVLILENPKEVVVKKNVSKKKYKSGYDTPQGEDNSYRGQRVFEVSKEMGYNNPNLALKVLKCESGLNPNSKNKNSSASGLGQHLARYRPARAKKYGYAGASVFDGEANLHVTIGMIRDGQLSAWNESKNCRGR